MTSSELAKRRAERRGRSHTLFGAILALCLLMTACGAAATTTDSTAAEIADAAANAQAGLAGNAGVDPDSLPTSRNDPALPEEEIVGTIRIGAALSETGKFSVEGRDSRQGYDTWQKWVNEVYGGIRLPSGRHEVEIIYYDDESDADTAANLVQRLIDEDEVDFLLGPYSSGLTTGASAISEAAGVIMVQGNATSDAIMERDFDNLFLVATVASEYTRSGIEAFAEQGARTAVVAYEDTSFPTAVANGALEHLEANGIEVLATATYPKDPTDLSSIISQFRGLEPDIFIGGGHYIDAVMFLNAAEDIGFEPDGMLMTVGPSNPALTEQLEDSVEGVVGPTQWEATMAYEGDWFGSAADFAARYESDWGEPAVYQAASASASALVLHIAIEQAATIETDQVREALHALDVETFYGPIGFDERGVNIAKPMGTVQVQGGVINVIAPDDAAVTGFSYPAVR